MDYNKIYRNPDHQAFEELLDKYKVLEDSKKRLLVSMDGLRIKYDKSRGGVEVLKEIIIESL